MKGTLEEEPGLDLTRRREGAEPRGPDEGSQEGLRVGKQSECLPGTVGPIGARQGPTLEELTA